MAESSPTHYDILGIPRNADQTAIRKAYLRSSLACHPDKNPDNPTYAKSQFIRVGEAYRVLKDPTSRLAYDRELAAGRCRERNYTKARRPESSSYGQRNNRQSSEAEFQSFMDMFDSTVAGMSPEEIDQAAGAAAAVGSVLGSIVGSRLVGSKGGGGAAHSLLSSAASLVGSAVASRAAASMVQTVHRDSARRVLEKEDREAAIDRGEDTTRHSSLGENRERWMKDAAEAVQKMAGAAAAFAAPMMGDDTSYSTRQNGDGRNNNNNGSVRFSFGNGSANR